MRRFTVYWPEPPAAETTTVTGLSYANDRGMRCI